MNTLFGPGLKQPSLREIAAHIASNVCAEGDCPRMGTPCEICAGPFCNQHASTIHGVRLCAECEKNSCPEGCGFYSDNPIAQAKHRRGQC